MREQGAPTEEPAIAEKAAPPLVLTNLDTGELIDASELHATLTHTSLARKPTCIARAASGRQPGAAAADAWASG